MAGNISEAQLLFTVFLFPIKLQSPPIKPEEAFLWVGQRNPHARRTRASAAPPGQSSTEMLFAWCTAENVAHEEENYIQNLQLQVFFQYILMHKAQII